MLTDLLPITALIRRELISSLRQGRFFYMVLTAVAAAGITVLVLWPRENPSPWEMKSASEGMFIFLGLTLALGAVLSVPALAGSSIVSEREEETFELLAMTTAKPWHVLTAKLVNSAGHYLLLVVALAPFAACAFFLVGMNTDILWRTLMIVSSTALACAAAGVLCSAKLRNPLAAVGVSYLAMLVILGLPWLLLMVVLELFGIRMFDSFLNHIGIYLLPAVAFVVALGGNFGSWSSARSVEICSLVNVALTMALVLVAHTLVRRNWGMSGNTEASEPTERPRHKPKGYSPRRSFRSDLNPVYLRECWCEYPLRGWMLLLQVWVPMGLAFCACILIVFLYVTENISPRDGAMIAFAGWHFMEAMLLPLLLASLTANMFTKEHERQNIDALRMTLLRPLEIFGGKLRASLRVALTLLLAACIGSAPLLIVAEYPVQSGVWARMHPLAHIFCVFVMLVECLAITWIVTAFCSIVARRMASALVLSFVVATMMLGGNAILVIVMGEGMRLYRVDNWVGMFSPYFAYGLLFDSPTNKDSIAGWYSSHAIVAGIMLLFFALSARLFASRHMQDR